MGCATLSQFPPAANATTLVTVHRYFNDPTVHFASRVLPMFCPNCGLPDVAEQCPSCGEVVSVSADELTGLSDGSEAEAVSEFPTLTKKRTPGSRTRKEAEQASALGLARGAFGWSLSATFLPAIHFNLNPNAPEHELGVEAGIIGVIINAIGIGLAIFAHKRLDDDQPAGVVTAATWISSLGVLFWLACLVISWQKQPQKKPERDPALRRLYTVAPRFVSALEGVEATDHCQLSLGSCENFSNVSKAQDDDVNRNQSIADFDPTSFAHRDLNRPMDGTCSEKKQQDDVKCERPGSLIFRLLVGRRNRLAALSAILAGNRQCTTAHRAIHFWLCITQVNLDRTKCCVDSG